MRDKLEGISRDLIALRVANELPDGSYVNLGIGIPTLVSNWIVGKDIVLQSESGMLNIGPLADEESVDQDLVNASCQPVTEVPGCSYFSSSDAFGMIRGGRIDVAVLGALQVSERGDLAGWFNPGRDLPEGVGNIGGSMDLAVGARKVIVAMTHVSNEGACKIVRECTYPLTARAVVDLIVTDLAVIAVTTKGLILKEVAPGLAPAQVQSVTGARLIVAPDIKEMQF